MSTHSFFLSGIALLTCLLIGCKHDSELVVAPITPTYAIGEPTSPQTTFTVTPAGGEFRSPDQSVKLIIPAGAVSKETQISMQAVENTAPAGTGPSIRLLPHNIQFERPVTIQFSYAKQESMPENTLGLGLAFQEETGIWRFAAKPVVDQTAKTVSVATTHFSDWVMAHYYKLIPVKTSVMAGEDVALQVVTYFADDLLAPLIIPEKKRPMGDAVPLDPKYIKNQGKGSAWTLGGIGTLTAIGSGATYGSPKSVAKPTQVNVMVELNNPNPDDPGKHWLVSTITVVPTGGTIYRINGGVWEFAESASVIKMNQDVFTITSPHPEKEFHFTLTWKGGVGTHPWNTQSDPTPDHANVVQLIDHQVGLASWWYDEQEGFLNSEGGIIIEDLGEKDGFVKGTFRATSAGIFNLKTGKMLEKTTIEGSFKVKRLF
ncbi:hypothetical protein GCM10028805_07710 [Spirosoma harenae]